MNAAVDVRFGSKMNDCPRLMAGQQLAQEFGIADVAPDKNMANSAITATANTIAAMNRVPAWYPKS